MSKDVIERAIKKATGELEGVEYEEIRYEGYAPGGVAVIVDCLTDNKVRTVADVRHAFGKFGGNLGTDGSVSFMFKKLGVLSFAPGADEDKITEARHRSRRRRRRRLSGRRLDRRGHRARCLRAGQGRDGRRRPQAPTSPRSPCAPTTTSPSAGETAQQVVKLLRWLEDMDDVQNVYSNADLGEDAYA